MVFNYDHFHFFFSSRRRELEMGRRVGGVVGNFFRRFLQEKILLLIIRAGEEKDIRRI